MSANRREFLTTSLAAGLAGGAALRPNPSLAADAPHSPIRPGSVILFQGDSITDAGRDKKNAEPNLRAGMGGGYAWMAGSHLLVDAPDAGLKVYNRGISGNKVHQLADRWQADCLDLKPDILSILIGVNDIWHKLNGKYEGTVETYEKDYRALLKRTKEALPDVKLVICEPFVLKCGAVNDSWFPEFDKFRAVSAMMAKEFQAIFVPFQTAFDRAVALADPKEWAGDGVHPSAYGAALMAHEWILAVGHSSV